MKRLNSVEKELQVLTIKKPNLQRFDMSLMGISSLIMSRQSIQNVTRWGTRPDLRFDAQHGPPPKTPEEEYKHSLLVQGEEENRWYGFPATSFKNAASHEATHLGFKTSEVRQWFWVDGTESGDHGLVRIDGEPRRREDMVHLPGKAVFCSRYRAEFSTWSTMLRIMINADKITKEVIHRMMTLAGLYHGVGDWCPTRNGPYGRFIATAFTHKQ